MVWILITTFMVVVGTGHCSDATASGFDLDSSSECQLLKASPQLVKDSAKQVIQGMQAPSEAIPPSLPYLSERRGTQRFASESALGRSMLAEMRFSGTSPPASLVF